MRFCQIDRIRELVPGQRLVAVKGLTLAEDYLKDHFPRFPVMPGVLMLETMNQAAMWLIYASEGFENSIVRLQQAKNPLYLLIMLNELRLLGGDDLNHEVPQLLASFETL